MRFIYTAIIASVCLFQSPANAESRSATVQALGSGTSCSSAVSNARANVLAWSAPTANEIATTEFATIQAFQAWCSGLALGGSTPSIPSEGDWLPIGSYVLPEGDEDARCSHDDANIYYTHQKGYVVCPAPADEES